MENNIEELKKDLESLDNLSEEELKAVREKYSKQLGVIHMLKQQALENKKKAEAKEKKKKEEAAKAKEPKYKFPFRMYFGHEYRDVSGVFQEGTEYSKADLTKELIAHGYKEFKAAATVEWEYFEDENCLFPKLKLGNRG